LYYKKAIIEFSLFDGEISRSINTINSGVDFINKNIERIDDENTTRKIINNYKSRLGILKDRYRATLNVAGIIETTDKLIAQKQFGQAETVLEDALLDVEKKSSDPIENFKYRMQILSRLVRVESMQGLKKNVLGYIDYGLDQVIKPFACRNSDEEILQANSNTEIEAFASTIVTALGFEDIPEAKTFIDDLQAIFPNNEWLKLIQEHLKDREKSIESLDGAVERLLKGNDWETAYLLIDEAQDMLKPLLEQSNPIALRIWSEKLGLEYQVGDLESFYQSLSFLQLVFEDVDISGEHYDDEIVAGVKLLSSEPSQSRDIAEALLKEDINYGSLKREKAYWLRFKSIQALGVRLGDSLFQGALEEFPDSRLILDLKESRLT
jgi:hypothetical protein